MLNQSNTHTKDYAPIGVRAQNQQIYNNSILPKTRKLQYKNEAKQRLISIEAENLWPKVQPANAKRRSENQTSRADTKLSLQYGANHG